MSTSRTRRWAVSPRDMRSHLLADDGRDPIGIVLAICGHIMPNSVDTGPQPTGTRCEACEPRPALDVAAPQFHTGHDPVGHSAGASAREGRGTPGAGPALQGYPQPANRVPPR